MKLLKNLIFILLYCLGLVVPTAYADDEIIEEFVIAKLFDADDEEFWNSLRSMEKNEEAVLLVYGDRASDLEPYNTDRPKKNKPVEIDWEQVRISAEAAVSKVPLALSYKQDRVFPRRLKAHEYRSESMDFEFSSIVGDANNTKGVAQIGAAFMTNVVLHEMGHDVIADYVEAEGSGLSFFRVRDGQFFLASSTVQSIDTKSRLPYNMGGEFAADMTFEYALKSYRENPSLYNRSLMFFSGTDFLLYSVYSYYLSEGHNHLDPIAVTEYGGISKDVVLSVALAKTLMNAYRIYSGEDRFIPYFTVDKYSAVFNVKTLF